ncbi:MAG: 6-bladed beta-propeller [Candidatus Saccharicenans sp.]|nr:6-bladed beta-propeller [Candidatus Saccharicenans sp.]
MKKVSKIMLILLPALLIITRVEAQKIRTVDGVTVVSNGKKPIQVKEQPASFSLQEELMIGGGEKPEESFSQDISFAVDDEGTIFALDFKEQKIKVFDRTGKYVRSIGRSGHGPGEWGAATGILLGPDSMLLVVDLYHRRLAVFRKTGEFVRNVSFSDKPTWMNIMMDDQGNILVMEMGIAPDMTRRSYEIKKYDPEFKPLFTLDKIELPVPIPGSGKKVNLFETFPVYQFGPEGRIYYGRNLTYEIKMFSPEGKHLRTISRDYDRIKITQQDIDEIMERVSGAISGINVKDMYSFPDFFPPVQSFILDEQGRIYVRTYMKGKNKGEHWIDVFDPEGRFIAQFISRADLRLIRNGLAYGIEVLEDGFQVIKRYKLLMK